jgi:hypothetical protein
VGSSEESGSVKDATNTTTGLISGTESQIQCKGRDATEGEAQKGLAGVMANGASQRTGTQQTAPPHPPPIQYVNPHADQKVFLCMIIYTCLIFFYTSTIFNLVLSLLILGGFLTENIT